MITKGDGDTNRHSDLLIFIVVNCGKSKILDQVLKLKPFYRCLKRVVGQMNVQQLVLDKRMDH